MKLDLSEIARIPGSYVEYEIEDFILPDGKEIGANYPINGKLIFQSVDNVLLITGNFFTKVDDICDRCGDTAIAEVTANIAEDFIVHPVQHEPSKSKKGRAEGNLPLVEEDEDTAECNLFCEGTFDLHLDELLRQNIVLNMPLKLLCKENCRGLCVNCGKPLSDDGECECSQDDINPQFAALQDLFKD